MARQGNSPTAVSKYGETTGDNRSFPKHAVVAAPEAGASRIQDARKVHHGDAFGAPGKPTVGSPGPARASNQQHTAEYAGPGQCESDGSRVGNTKHTETGNNDKSPQRHTAGGKVVKTSEERFATRKNGQQN